MVSSFSRFPADYFWQRSVRTLLPDPSVCPSVPTGKRLHNSNVASYFLYTLSSENFHLIYNDCKAIATEKHTATLKRNTNIKTCIFIAVYLSTEWYWTSWAWLCKMINGTAEDSRVVALDAIMECSLKGCQDVRQLGFSECYLSYWDTLTLWHR